MNKKSDVKKTLTGCDPPSEAAWTGVEGGAGCGGGTPVEEDLEGSFLLRMSLIRGKLSAKSLSEAFSGTRLTDSPAGVRFSVVGQRHGVRDKLECTKHLHMIMMTTPAK